MAVAVECFDQQVAWGTVPRHPSGPAAAWRALAGWLPAMVGSRGAVTGWMEVVVGGLVVVEAWLEMAMEVWWRLEVDWRWQLKVVTSTTSQCSKTELLGAIPKKQCKRLASCSHLVHERDANPVVRLTVCLFYRSGSPAGGRWRGTWRRRWLGALGGTHRRLHSSIKLKLAVLKIVTLPAGTNRQSITRTLTSHPGHQCVDSCQPTKPINPSINTPTLPPPTQQLTR